MTRIVIFASGAGSNAQNIIRYFSHHPSISVALVATNNPKAGVLNIAVTENILSVILEKDRFFNGDGYVELLQEHRIGLIVLAGFLWKVPQTLIRAYPSSIVNIHPALLPAFGGKGMYGLNVHHAVLAAGENTSGITIHFVDEHYDNGDIIFQERCKVMPDDTPETLAAKIHALEYTHFPRVIEQVIGARGDVHPSF